MRPIRYVSVFSGIEAATVAWEPLGFVPVAFSEIDEFPCAVLRTRFPNVPNLGDITKIDWSPYVGAVDLVVGGSPCQSFSIAGSREGLSGTSGLMYEYVRCVQELLPEFIVWENVTGALSAERGWAFEQLLSSLDELGYGLAWRVLNSAFFGVAQQRRRVFLVGHLGDTCACDVLFEPGSMRRNYQSCKAKRAELSQASRDSVNKASLAFKVRGGAATYLKHDGSIGTAGKGLLISDELAFTLSSKLDQTILQQNDEECIVRRLTPTECERLQGFPDGYTNIGNWTDSYGRTRKSSNRARYKALGNSMCVNVMRWIGRRLMLVWRMEDDGEICVDGELEDEMRYAYDVGFDEGYQCGYEDGVLEASSQKEEGSE